jgi:hypothetical protein
MFNDLLKIFKNNIRSLEILYLLNDLKEVVRIDAYDEEFNLVLNFCKKNNLNIEMSDFKIIKETDKGKGLFSNKGIKTSLSSTEKGVVFLYISKSKEKAMLAKKFENESNNKDFGLILDYPKCCVDFFVKNNPVESQKQNDYILPALKNSDNFVFPFYNNHAVRYFDVSLLSHFPCSFNCKESIKIAKKNLELIKKYSTELAKNFEEILSSGVLYTEYNGVFLLKNAELKNLELFYQCVEGTAKNSIYNLLKFNEKIKIINKNHIEVGDLKLKGDNIGFMVFE